MSHCIDFSTGNVLHFPAGTYREQTKTEYGRIELEMMRWLFRIERFLITSETKKPSEFSKSEKRLNLQMIRYKRTGSIEVTKPKILTLEDYLALWRLQ